MRITFTARHFRPSEALKEHAETEVRRLKKYYDGILEAEIILDYIKQQQVAEIIVKVYGNKIPVIIKSEDMFKSITLAVDTLERNILKYKEKNRQFENERITENISEKND